MDSVMISLSRIMKTLLSGWIYQGYPPGSQDLLSTHINAVVFEQDFAIAQTTLFMKWFFQIHFTATFQTCKPGYISGLTLCSKKLNYCSNCDFSLYLLGDRPVSFVKILVK